MYTKGREINQRISREYSMILNNVKHVIETIDGTHEYCFCFLHLK